MYYKKEKLLFICPHFMEYDKKIISCLDNKYEVNYIDTNCCLARIRTRYKEKNLASRIFLKLLVPLRNLCRERMLKEIDNEYIKHISIFQDYSIILVINGDGMSNMIYQYLRKYNAKAKFILFLWDDVKGLFKTKHFIFFDDIFSYNLKDCKQRSFEYLPMFTEKFMLNSSFKKEYDISIIATANPERIKLAKMLYEKYNSIYKFYIRFYSVDTKYDFYTYDKPLSFEDYMTVLAKSKSILEIVRFCQTGPTTRIFDALETKTKIITTNNFINLYADFNKNVLVLDKKMTIPNDFLREPYIYESYKSIYIEDWVKRILKNVME